jgi:hypothetical protein
MNAPTQSSLTPNTQMIMNWIPQTFTESGDSTILSYALWWDSGLGGVYTELTGTSADFTGSQYAITSGIT